MHIKYALYNVVRAVSAGFKRADAAKSTQDTKDCMQMSDRILVRRGYFVQQLEVLVDGLLLVLQVPAQNRSQHWVSDVM